MKKTGLILLMAAMITVSCKKTTTSATADPRVPPKLDFKTTALYVSKDTTVVKQDTLLFGIIATKTEDNLTSFNLSYAYDASTSTTTFFNHFMTSYEYTGYTKDMSYTVRNQTGTETLTFTVVDKDGNITKKKIVVTVI